jgi:hypothetical protein
LPRERQTAHSREKAQEKDKLDVAVLKVFTAAAAAVVVVYCCGCGDGGRDCIHVQ